MNLPKRVLKQVRTALGDQLKPPKIWGWDEVKITPHFCSFTIILSALCWKCVSVSHRTTAHKKREKKENLQRLGFGDQLIPWLLIPVNFNRLMPAQCYLSFMGWSDFIRLFLSLKGLTEVMVISLNRILMVISPVKKLQDVQEISIPLLSQVAMAWEQFLWHFWKKCQ